MSSYTGVLAPGSDYNDNFDFTIGAIKNWTKGVGQPLDYDDESPALVGPWTSQFPVSMPKNSLSGVRAPNYVDDFYYRFWVTPNTFNEFIITEVQRSFTIWNAWITPSYTTCSDVNVSDATNVEFYISSSEPPFDILSLRTRTLSFTLPVDGNATFTAFITFDFGIYGSPYITIQGTRLVAFGWEPRLPLMEKLEWNTSIVRSRDGGEQRMALRLAPRQMYRYDVYFNSESEQSKFDVILHRQQKLAWGLPIWSEWSLHTSTVNISDTIIYFDTSYADYRDDSLAIIWQGPTSFEVVEISTVQSDRINLTSGVLNQWTGDKYILPLRVAYMVATVNRESAPDGFGGMTCDFVCRSNIEITGYSASKTYNGSAVLGPSITDDGPQSLQSDDLAAFNDPGYGTLTKYSLSDFNAASKSHVIRLYGRSNCWDYRQFLHSLHGMRDIVWIPTYKNDIPFTTTIGGASSTFDVTNQGLSKYMGLNDLRMYLAFIFPDGSELYREIISITEISSVTETIEIDSPLGSDVDPGECEISWLDRCRLSDDTVEIEWESNSFLRSKINFTRVQQ